MARTNTRPVNTRTTHEGARAQAITPLQELRRAVCSCLLWEDAFYEDGKSIASRIASLIETLSVTKNAQAVCDLAIEARTDHNLRHVPLFMVREMARYKGYSGSLRVVTEAVIQRADEPGELLSLYWKDGKCPLASSVRRGIRDAMSKFNNYSLAKYNSKRAGVKLRDVLRITHPAPIVVDGTMQDFHGIIHGTIKPADTWENRLSNLDLSEDVQELCLINKGDASRVAEIKKSYKRMAWEALLHEEKLGAFAMLRNLRNMEECGVERKTIGAALAKLTPRAITKVLPFRFIAAAKAAPWAETILAVLLQSKLKFAKERLDGETVLLVDTSGSMTDTLSAKSDMTRGDAAGALAMILKELCDELRVYAFDDELREMPDRRGFPLMECLAPRQHGTNLGGAVAHLIENVPHKRLIVITDEQTTDRVPEPSRLNHNYLINVASYQNGVSYGGNWTHVDGFSEGVVRWLYEYENAASNDEVL